MRFRDIKQQVIRCLREGAYLHEARCEIATKNVFANRRVDRDWVIELISRASGDDWRCSPHHQHSDIDVHIFRIWKNGGYWYVKFYFVEPNTVFISVHPDIREEKQR